MKLSRSTSVSLLPRKGMCLQPRATMQTCQLGGISLRASHAVPKPGYKAPGIGIQRADALLERQQALVDFGTLQPRLLVIVVRVCTSGRGGCRLHWWCAPGGAGRQSAFCRLPVSPAGTSTQLLLTRAALTARQVDEGQLSDRLWRLIVGAQRKAQDGVRAARGSMASVQNGELQLSES